MKFKSFLFVVLALCSVCYHEFVDQYEIAGPDLVTGHWQKTAGKNQAVQIDSGRFFLVSEEPAKSVSIRHEIKKFPEDGHLQLSARMQYANVVAGPKPWNRARLLLVQNDGKRNRYDIAHAVASFEGGGEWKSYQAVFPVSPVTQKMVVIAQLSKCIGSFDLEDVRLFPVVLTAAYTWTGRAMLLGWACFGIFLLGDCLVRARAHGVLKIIAAAAFGLVILGTCMPVEMKKEVSQTIVKQVNQAVHMAEDSLPRDYSKFGHLFFFSLLGLTFAAVMKDNFSPGTVFFHILFVAGGTEMAQFFIEGRSPLVSDFFIDAGGGLLGCSMVWLFNHLFLIDSGV